MAAEISEITESNQDSASVMLECLRILRKIETVLDEWQPTMDRFRAPAAAFLVSRGARRRAVPQDSNGQVPHP